MARVKRNFTTILKKPGNKSVISDDHIKFLKNWFTSQ